MHLYNSLKQLSTASIPFVAVKYVAVFTLNDKMLAWKLTDPPWGEALATIKQVGFADISFDSLFLTKIFQLVWND